jgi:5-formyltetrahydrofolate cyclo-ligase
VARLLQSTPEFRRASRLVAYAALADELPLTAVIEAARGQGIRLLWPRQSADGGLEFAPAERIEELLPGRYGVLEPPAAAPAERLGADALVLVPGVAFDAAGGRLGRGGGAWDRALAGARGAVVFGVGYEIQIVDRVPREEHDHLMHAVLTEACLRRCGAS